MSNRRLVRRATELTCYGFRRVRVFVNSPGRTDNPNRWGSQREYQGCCRLSLMGLRNENKASAVKTLLLGAPSWQTKSELFHAEATTCVSSVRKANG